MPYEYVWGVSMDQRGTTDLTINTAFIHTKTSITAYITSQCMVGQPFISRYSLWRELTTISFININYIIKFWNITGLNKPGADLLLLHGELRSEWMKQCLEPGWSGDHSWPSKAHGFPYKVYGLDLQTSQLPCHILHCKTADKPWSLGVQIWKFYGGVQHK